MLILTIYLYGVAVILAYGVIFWYLILTSNIIKDVWRFLRHNPDRSASKPMLWLIRHVSLCFTSDKAFNETRRSWNDSFGKRLSLACQTVAIYIFNGLLWPVFINCFALILLNKSIRYLLRMFDALLSLISFACIRYLINKHEARAHAKLKSADK